MLEHPMKVLHIDSSIMADASVSRQLSQAIVSQLSEKHAQVEVEYLDLATQPIPHLDAEILMGQNAEQSALGERIIQQYLDADVVVIGAAMYNFGITSTLKAWIDRISVAGGQSRYCTHPICTELYLFTDLVRTDLSLLCPT